MEDIAMKKRLISIVVVLVALAVAWTTFAASGAAGTRAGAGRGGVSGMSEEERAKMKEKFQNMSEEERAKFREEMRGRFENMSEEERAQMRSRFGSSTRLSREEQLKAIKAVEEQVAKLKASIESSARPADANFSALSEEERTKLRDQFTKAREARQAAVDAIRAEIDKLSPPRPTPAQMEALRELREIRTLAEKEKAAETTKRLAALIEKQAQLLSPIMGGRRGAEGTGTGAPGTPGAPGTERTPRRPRTEGGATKP
jgi:hypothetical protein